MEKIPFGGRILLLGCGSVSQCLQPLLLKHFEMDFSRLTIMDFENNRHRAQEALAAGAQYKQQQITRENIYQILGENLSSGDLLIDVAWNISTADLIDWCQDHNVLYINTSVELWDPYDITTKPQDRTLYVRHMELRRRQAKRRQVGATAVVEHGANPGLVSHWTKVALHDITTRMLETLKLKARQKSALEKALANKDYAQLAMLTGVKVIHVSERDTQISDRPKEVDEFVNTWSVEGLYEEGVAPAEMGWGTHERTLPKHAQTFDFGPGNQICLAQMGMNTYVRSWVPLGGEIIGMVIRHGEAFTISDHLTVREHGRPIYRPTVHYAYMPTDAAITSLHELKMRNYEQQSKIRIMNDEIISGRDELGVLLLGHALNGWWVGSQLDIDAARRLVPSQNATTLQVAASIMGALFYMIRNPQRGLLVPDDLPHEDVLAVASPYLGPCPSVQTDWNPLKNRWEPFMHFGRPLPPEEEMWQFETFLVNTGY